MLASIQWHGALRPDNASLTVRIAPIFSSSQHAGANPLREPSRVAMVAFFASCGGAIGGVLFIGGLLVLGLFQPRGPASTGALETLSGIFLVLPFAVFFGTLVGFVPAAVGGAIYAFMPGQFHRVRIAALIGAVVSAAWAVISNMTTIVAGLTLAGAGSGLVCARIARKFGIDSFQATRRGGPANG
jgi:hypothetical protein